MALEHWHYFCALDRDFAVTTAFVEPCAKNFGVDSIQYAKIILASCSEIDVVAKVLCASIDPSSRADNINAYRALIVAKYPKLPTMEVLVPRYSLRLRPWEAWGDAKNPPWWGDHNLVKHQRHKHIDRANLINCLNSLAGLFVVVLYLNHEQLFADQLDFMPLLFSIETQPHFLTMGNYALPDISQPEAPQKTSKKGKTEAG